MIWKTPRKLIEKILFYSALLSLLLAGCFVWLAVSWPEMKDQVRDYDKSIKNQFVVLTQRKKIALDKTTDENEQLRLHQEILELLKDNTNLNHHQDQLAKSHLFIIEHHLKNNQTAEALVAAEHFANTQPYHIPAQIKQVEVRFLIDQQAALTAMEELARRFFDVPLVQSAYVRLLIQADQFDQARSVAQQFQVHLKDYLEPTFMFYHANQQQPKYSQQRIIRIKQGDYQKTGDRYRAEVSIQVNDLRRLRFDLDLLNPGSRLVELQFAAKLNGQTHQLAFEASHHLQQLAGDWVTTGTDPYVELLLPAALKGTSEPLTLLFDLVLDRKQLNPIDELFANGLWSAEQSASTMSFLPAGNSRYVAQWTQQTDQLTIILPPINGLNFAELSLSGQGGNVPPHTYQGLEQISQGWVITDDQPSLHFTDVAGQSLTFLVGVNNDD